MNNFEHSFDLLDNLLPKKLSNTTHDFRLRRSNLFELTFIYLLLYYLSVMCLTRTLSYHCMIYLYIVILLSSVADLSHFSFPSLFVVISDFVVINVYVCNCTVVTQASRGHLFRDSGAAVRSFRKTLVQFTNDIRENTAFLDPSRDTQTHAHRPLAYHRLNSCE